MKKLILLLSFILPLGISAQKKDKNAPPAELFQCWSGSIEEDDIKSNKRTYRLCDYKFPPSMWRPTVKFENNGTCQVLHLGATDLHYYVDCTWTYDKKKKRITVVDKDKKLEMKFKIISVNKEVLKFASEM